MQIYFFERGIQLFQLVNISNVQESCENSRELVFGFQELNCDWLINNVPCLLFGWREVMTGKMSFCGLEKHNTETNFIWSPWLPDRLCEHWFISMEFWGLNCWCLHCETSQAASRDACTCRLLSHRLAEMKVHFGKSSVAHNNYYSNIQPVRFHLNSSIKGFCQLI